MATIELREVRGMDIVEAVTGASDSRVRAFRIADLVTMHVVVTGRYLVVVDTLTGPGPAGQLMDMVAPQAAGRPTIVVNTHADYDHAWGNQVFAGEGPRYPAPILATGLCAQRLRGPICAAELADFRQKDPETFGDVILTPPTVLFDRRLDVDGGDLTLQLIATPGHTADHASVFIPQASLLLAADAAEMPFPSPEDARSVPHLRESLRKLKELGAETVLYCHAPPESGPALLAHNIDYYDRLERRCRAAVDRHRGPVPHDDLAAWADFPFAEAVPPGVDPASVPAMYVEAHSGNIAAMTGWLECAGST